MFQSVLERQGLRAGRLGSGAWVSFGVHVGLLAAVVLMTGQAPAAPDIPAPVVLKTYPRGPTIAKGTPAPVKPAQANTPPPRPKRPHMPSAVKPLPVDQPPPDVDPPAASSSTSDDTTAASTGGGEQGGDPNGDPNSTSPIGHLPIPGLETALESTGTDILPFGAAMTPPVRQGGEPLAYTHEALAARVEGSLVVKCVITDTGSVHKCRIIKGLPFMNEAVVEALESWHYSPVLFQGRPVSVSYVFNLKLKLPR
ncbi:energy transducer TonB [Corallococcus sp. H22C18031201]|nr:energy transducer TonB [Corallococcus sp. H22C18031201]